MSGWWRRGPRRHSRVPAHAEMGDCHVVRGKVVEIDPVSHTCIVQGTNDEGWWEGVQWMPPTPVKSGGRGSFYMPEVGSLVWLLFPSADATPFILGGSNVPAELDEGDEDEDPNSYRMNRPVLNEGDHVIASSELGNIIMRKGGTIEIGAAQAARRFYIPLRNMVREFFENWEAQSPGGSLEWLCRRDDESHGADLTPVEFRLRVREFCEGLPIIDLGLGRIAAEDDEKIPFTPEKGQIIARVLINNRYRLWIDKAGNMATVTAGLRMDVSNGPRIQHDEGTFWHHVKGLFRSEYGVRNATVAGTDTLQVGRDRETSIGGDLTETVAGQVTRTVSGPVTEKTGARSLDVAGEVNRSVTGNVNDTSAGGRTINTAEDHVENIGQTKSVQISNAKVDGVAYLLNVLAGEMRLYNKLGKCVFASGGPTVDSAVAKIVLRVATPPSLGTLELITNLGTTKLEMNATGMRITTGKGAASITIDAKGSVSLGPPGQGFVVTTLSHPVDFVTGLPIRGSSSVSAGGLPVGVGTAPPTAFTPAPPAP